ncbi:MAG: hypothetical protein V3S37_05550 [Dehalococcoidia bacterium]
MNYAAASIERTAAEERLRAAEIQQAASAVQLEAERQMALFNSLPEKTRRMLVRMRDMCNTYWRMHRALVQGEGLQEEARIFVERNPSSELVAQSRTVAKIKSMVEELRTEREEGSPQRFWNVKSKVGGIRLALRQRMATSLLKEAEATEAELFERQMSCKIKDLAHAGLQPEQEELLQLVKGLEREVDVRSYVDFLNTTLPFNQSERC